MEVTQIEKMLPAVRFTTGDLPTFVFFLEILGPLGWFWWTPLVAIVREDFAATKSDSNLGTS